MTVGNESSPNRDQTDDQAGDAFSVKEFVVFAGRSIRLNLGLFFGLLLLIGGVGFTLVSAMPPLYEATFKIFVQEGGAVTTSIVSGREYKPAEAGKGFDEFLYARNNLMAFVRDARLVESWPRTRSWPMRLKDQLVERLRGPADKSAMQRAFAEMLYDLIAVKKEDNSIRVSGRWRDPQNAYDIARVAKRSLLASRAAQEFGPIARAIPFLEAQQEQADQDTEAAIRGALVAFKAATPEPVVHVPGTRPVKAVDTAQVANQAAREASLVEAASLSRELAEVRREKKALTEPGKAKIAEMRAKLVDLRAQYSADHPVVRQLEARIEVAGMESEEVVALRKRESELTAMLASRLSVRRAGASKSNGAAEENDGSDDQAGGNSEKAAPPPTAEDLAFAPLKQRVGAALKKSEEITSRLEMARIELESAEAEFNNRYTIVEEPEIPNAPLKSKKSLFTGLVFLAAVLVAAGAAIGREMIRGRLVEAWQVRALGLPVLAEVRLKKLPGAKG